MHLTRYSDFAMRILLYLAARPERVCSISEISGAYGISQNHLMKIAHDLGKAGYVAAARGRTGGLRLGRPAADIRVGELIRHTEDDFELVDCPNCILSRGCGLSSVLDEAMDAFMAVLDRYTLADLMERRRDVLRLLLSSPSDMGHSPPVEP